MKNGQGSEWSKMYFKHYFLKCKILSAGPPPIVKKSRESSVWIRNKVFLLKLVRKPWRKDKSNTFRLDLIELAALQHEQLSLIKLAFFHVHIKNALISKPKCQMLYIPEFLFTSSVSIINSTLTVNFTLSNKTAAFIDLCP